MSALEWWVFPALEFLEEPPGRGSRHSALGVATWAVIG